ncbi:MtN19-like protein, putative isoform 1 [Hibiscus syriacus]|uniref:Short-chain dehydrogenase/reductase n=1 Tax=Hibiscus syriacus TaxID=106335 RepID=A0A6A3BS72_HIBSY|nr:(+)-neomenthol dehydrogenase-like [Hibiscus syriacus]KAE8719696.1 MtN19-like protein, putative isoform 1 [Hibiscus syriacus]
MTGRKEKSIEKREKRLQEISLLRTIPYSDHQRWWSAETIAVVTGANRGIGFEIARQLAGHGLTVILTSRDTGVGIEAAKVLQEGGFNVDVHQLDILHDESVSEFTKWIKEKYGGVDILINNAGVNYNLGSGNSMEFSKTMIETNYYGTKNMVKAMIPLMRPSAAGARIVNVSSRLGKLNGRRSRIEDEALRAKLSNLETLSEELIDNMVSTFLQQVEDNTWQSGGWPQKFTDYAVSKLAVNLYSVLLANQLAERPEGRKIYINCYCPGWVRTAMTGWSGNVSAEHAADTGVWLALLPNKEVTGKLFAERRELKL